MPGPPTRTLSWDAPTPAPLLWGLSIHKGTSEWPSSQLTLPQAGLESRMPHILLLTIQPDAVLCEVLADGGSCDGF